MEKRSFENLDGVGRVGGSGEGGRRACSGGIRGGGALAFFRASGDDVGREEWAFARGTHRNRGNGLALVSVDGEVGAGLELEAAPGTYEHEFAGLVDEFDGTDRQSHGRRTRRRGVQRGIGRFCFFGSGLPRKRAACPKTAPEGDQQGTSEGCGESLHSTRMGDRAGKSKSAGMRGV